MSILQFDKKQEMLRKTVKEFVEKEIVPIAAEIDEQDIFPEELFQKMGQMGYNGIFVPREYGGAGMGYTERAILLEEISRHSAGLAMAVMTHHLGVAAILDFGTEEQKKKYLPDLCSGKKIGGLAVTEPSGGSDLMGHQSTGEKIGEGWVLNGRKCFITNSHVADVSVVTVRTGEDAKGRPALSGFIIEKGTEGFAPGHKENKFGLRGSVMGDLNINDCHVSSEALLGQEGKAAKIALSTIGGVGRPGMAAISVGILRACLEESVKFAKERVIYGKPLAKVPAIQSIIAKNRIDYEAGMLLTYQAIGIKDTGEKSDTQSAIAKHYTTEAAVVAAKRTIDLMGGYGCINEYPAGRYLRDAMTTIPSGGTTQIMELVIAGASLA